MVHLPFDTGFPQSGLWKEQCYAVWFFLFALVLLLVTGRCATVFSLWKETIEKTMKIRAPKCCDVDWTMWIACPNRMWNILWYGLFDNGGTKQQRTELRIEKNKEQNWVPYGVNRKYSSIDKKKTPGAFDANHSSCSLKPTKNVSKWWCIFWGVKPQLFRFHMSGSWKDSQSGNLA